MFLTMCVTIDMTIVLDQTGWTILKKLSYLFYKILGPFYGKKNLASPLTPLLEYCILSAV